MKKCIAAVMGVVIALGASLGTVYGGETQNAYQQIETAGLTINWLELEGTYVDFISHYNEEGLFNVQVTEDGEYVSNRYGQPFFMIYGGYGKVDASGNVVVPFEYDEMVGEFSDGLAYVYKYLTSDSGIRYTSGGYVNKAGEVAIPLQYDSVRTFSEGLAAVKTDSEWHPVEDDRAISSTGGVYGYINTKGDWVIEPQFERAEGFHNGVAVVEQMKISGDMNYYVSGLIDKEGNMVVDFDRNLYISHNRGTDYYTVQDHSTEKYGLIDSTGKEILPVEYEYIYSVNGGKVCIGQNGKQGLIDLDGNAVIPTVYDELSGVYLESNLLTAYRWVETADEARRLTTYFDWNGNTVIPEGDYSGNTFEYEITGFYANENDNPTGLSYMDYRNGALNLKGEEILPPKYQDVTAVADDRLSVTFGGYSALFDEAGKRLTAFQYATIREFEEGLSIVSRDGFYGIINKQGVEVTPAVFSQISVIDNGKAMVALELEEDNISRIGILELPAEMAARTSNKPGFIRASLNGRDIPFDQDPVIVDDRTLVPMRAIFEELGAVVEWDHDKQQVTGVRNENGETTEVKLVIGDKTAYVNGEAVELDVAASLQGGRTFVPLRFVAESLDMDVVWKEEEQLIVITD